MPNWPAELLAALLFIAAIALTGCAHRATARVAAEYDGEPKVVGSLQMEWK